MNDPMGADAALQQLVTAYGPPSQAGFGSAVFQRELAADADLAQAALAVYREFVGELWSRWGEDAWMGPWKEVYRRADGAARNVVAELGAIDDPAASLSVPMILDHPDALSAAFDDRAVSDLRVFNTGDGGAMSGVLVAGRRAGQGIFLVFLLD